MPVTNGDVRQELERMFGPNIIANLDSIGMSFDEAWKMVQGDITIKRMLYVRVNMKVLSKINPKEVRLAYEKYLPELQRPTQWTYHVLSVRHKKPAKAEAAAQLMHDLLASNETSFDKLSEEYKNIDAIDKNVQISFSPEYKHTHKDISEDYKTILTAMTPGTYSEPAMQRSRSQKSTVYRIFYLKAMEEGGAVPFLEVEGRLKAALVDQAVDKETKVYLDKLRKKAGLTGNKIKETIPKDFEPFVLR
jgi:hypothetical protein